MPLVWLGALNIANVGSTSEEHVLSLAKSCDSLAFGLEAMFLRYRNYIRSGIILHIGV